MTALAANKEVVQKVGDIVESVMAVDIIYKGALLMHNAAGFLAPCAAEAGARFAGVAYEKKDNSGGSAGDIKVKCLKNGRYLLDGSGFAQTDVGEKVYATDDATITKTQAVNTQFVGVIDEYVSSSQCYVNINPAMDGAGKGSDMSVIAAGEFTTAGGDTDETITIAGLLATDIVLVALHTAGSSPVTVIDAAAAAGQIDVDMSADPSTDHVLSYIALRA